MKRKKIRIVSSFTIPQYLYDEYREKGITPEEIEDAILNTLGIPLFLKPGYDEERLEGIWIRVSQKVRWELERLAFDKTQRKKRSNDPVSGVKVEAWKK